jgi:hypothetical protein
MPPGVLSRMQEIGMMSSRDTPPPLFTAEQEAEIAARGPIIFDNVPWGQSLSWPRPYQRTRHILVGVCAMFAIPVALVVAIGLIVTR